MTSTSDHYDIALIGFGPVGATAANLMGRAGLRVLAIDRDASPHAVPRATHLDDEALRILQACGMLEKIRPLLHPLPGTQFLNAASDVLLEVPLENRPTLSGFSPANVFYQPDLDRVLREAAATIPGVEVRLGWELTALSQSPAAVTLDLRRTAGGPPATDRVTASYAIGCDGAHSFTRKTLGVPLRDFAFDQPWLVVDLLADPDLDLPDWHQQICDPARPTTFVPGPGRHRRFEFMLLPDENPDAVQSEANVRRLLARWIPDGRSEILRRSVYTFHGLLARRWRTGRVLLAGDAAHQMPPFLGQGLCAGLRDVMNLTWKLRAVHHSALPDSLLDTYETERSPHVADVIEKAIRVGGLIQTTDRRKAFVRDGFLRAAARFPALLSSRFDPAMPPLGPGVFSASAPAAHRPFARRPMLQTEVETAQSGPALLDDLLGPFWSIVLFDAAPHPDFLEVLDRLPVRIRVLRVMPAVGQRNGHLFANDPSLPRVTDATGRLREWFAERRADAVLIRPDRYVFGLYSTGQGAAPPIRILPSDLCDALGVPIPPPPSFTRPVSTVTSSGHVM